MGAHQLMTHVCNTATVKTTAKTTATATTAGPTAKTAATATAGAAAAAAAAAAGGGGLSSLRKACLADNAVGPQGLGWVLSAVLAGGAGAALCVLDLSLNALGDEGCKVRGGRFSRTAAGIPAV